jgi:hypothetical protein
VRYHEQADKNNVGFVPGCSDRVIFRRLLKFKDIGKGGTSMNRSKKEPIGKRFDKAVNKTGKKVGKGKDKIVGVKEDIADAAHVIGKSVKQTARDTGEAVSGVFRKKK